VADLLRVLIVDDDFMVARIHRRYVEAAPGFTVVGEAHTFAEARGAVADLAPDLVLLDLYLPDSDVATLLATMLGPDTPADVIVLSAANDAETVRSAFRGGAQSYVVKPFSGEDLALRLAEYRRHRASAERAVAGQGDALGQGAVDAIFGRGRTAPPGRPLPKGLAAPTLALVTDALVAAAGPGDGTLSAAECGDAVGLARVSARRYLEHLVEVGEATVEHRYGGSGRPERRYRPTRG
jgi:response regulator of citrate/malate metabolism